ncbi:Inner membrane symporter YicJ [Alteromonas sp. 38]|uniref:glycoside-pentoside-hexuronide (GPH):cation symporter n=1 Tax=unclassified Alteromonas TaxID=2614992 RepID=UPI0012EFB7C8|nr:MULTISPECIES: glycoside-pentoside-hexuronide (GPH):cation symporter [unclassified Alteromonas]CAD5249089.1 Inner membrane symporter YicJ [Alteromonas sp. 154]VXC47649.1 Inner membrane symporter YicJ [Alteromonas sp. 38]
MVSAKEKIAYGLGDTASNFIFQTVMLFLTFYYTDVVGIPAAAVGSMFLLVRVFDAVTDPLMGSLADRTRTRWGAYRPYLLWLALPFALCSVLAFTSPEWLTEEGKLYYAFITYALLMIMYTAINIPYSALGGVLSADASERVSIQSYRFVFAMGGGLLVTSFMLPLVDYLGNGNEALGYQRAMIVMSIVGMVLFLLCFAGTKERVKPANETPAPYKTQLAAIWQNDQCRVLCMVAIVLLTGMVMRNTLALYYVKYVLQRPESATLFVTAGMVGSIIGCALANPVAKRFCKIKVYTWLQLASAVVCIVNYFVPYQEWFTAISLHFLWGLILQMATPLLWAKIADVVDYGEDKTGLRMTGLTYSTVVFFIKVGLALGGALAGWLLASVNYQPDAFSPDVAKGIVALFCIGPAIASIGVAIIMRWYTLDNQNMLAIQQRLGLTTDDAHRGS